MKTVKRLKWEKKLTVKELKHVREWGGKTLAGFKANRKEQAKNNIQCFECRQIARKLGLEV